MREFLPKIADQDGRFKISVSEILEIQKHRDEIQSINLSSIDFMDDSGKKIDIDPKILSDFKFTGLSNIDLIITGFYKTGFDKEITE